MGKLHSSSWPLESRPYGPIGRVGSECLFQISRNAAICPSDVGPTGEVGQVMVADIDSLSQDLRQAYIGEEVRAAVQEMQSELQGPAGPSGLEGDEGPQGEPGTPGK